MTIDAVRVYSFGLYLFCSNICVLKFRIHFALVGFCPGPQQTLETPLLTPQPIRVTLPQHKVTGSGNPAFVYTVNYHTHTHAREAAKGGEGDTHTHTHSAPFLTAATTSQFRSDFRDSRWTLRLDRFLFLFRSRAYEHRCPPRYGRRGTTEAVSRHRAGAK